MGFTYPTTRSTGYVMGASTWNADVVDNMRWLGNDAPSCKAAMSGVQSIPVGVTTSLSFDTEWWDTAGLHSVSVNPTRFTAPVTGRYQIQGMIRFPAANYNGFLEAYINDIATNDRSGMAFSSSADYGISYLNEYEMSAGSFIQLAAWHNNGSALNLWGHCIVKWVGQ